MAEDRPEFACNACLVAFPDHETMRAHYKTDWHIYNSRRKVAGLAAISQEMWDEKWKAVANAKEATKGIFQDEKFQHFQIPYVVTDS